MQDDPQPINNKNTYASPKQFIKKTKQLLQQQEKYEIDLFNDMTKNKSIAQIQSLGYGLSAMTVVSTKRGFYGKTILTLTKTYHSQKNPLLIPDHCKVQVGDDVAIFKNNNIVADGVVSKRAGPKIQISMRKENEDDNQLQGLNCNIILKWNQVTFRRYFKILDEMEQSQSPLLNIFFQAHPSKSHKKFPQQEYKNQKLNQEQNQAVRLSFKEPALLLHGPPGTGKTTTVCQLIVQAVKRNQKVLACGPSNISVDNIVEGLSKKVNCVRIGNPARMIDNVIEHCLDFRISQKQVNWKGQVKKLQNARKRIGKASRDQKKAIYNEIRQLKDQIFHLQEQAIQQILDDVDVICCTNVGAYDRIFKKYLPKRIFDMVVIDQCGQSLEVACWIPILKGRRVILAGDHKQLPPTIQGNDNSLLSYTLFTRAMEELNNITSTMLCVQYRMNSAIMGWSNSSFYQNKLKAHQSVASHRLQHLSSKVSQNEETILMIDTSGCGMGEQGQANESKMNIGEADIAVSIYKKLLEYEVRSNYIAVLTPYSKQVAYIKTLMTEAGLNLPDISTVDGIQGRQKQCIIISLVRSNSHQDIGFLKDWRRMNVAVTRARRMLILIGNAECASIDPYLKSLIQWISENGHITSAQQFRNDPAVRFGRGASDKIQHKDKKVSANKQKQAQKQSKKKKQKDNNNKKISEQPNNQHSLQQQNAVKQHYKKVFSQIMRQITINNATAFERKMIHETAQQMGLCHETSNDKKFIKVWKKLTNDEVAQKYAQLQKLKYEQDIAEAKKKQKKKLKKQNREAKQLKQSNIGPHKFSEDIKILIGNQQDSGDQKIKQQPVKQSIQQNTQQIKQNPKKKKKRMKQQKKQQQQDNIQQIMKQFTANQPKENQCYQCKKRITSVTSVQCKFCKISYCRSHVLAEEHGCEQAARKQARSNKRQIDKHLQEATQRLKQKIKQQQDSRKRKGKQTKK